MDEFNQKPNKREKNQKSILAKMSRVIKKVTEKDGFYIILFICICIVGTTAVWVSKENIDKANQLDNNEYLDFADGYLDDIEYFEEEKSTDVTLIEIEKDTETKDTKDKGASTPKEQKTKVVPASSTSKEENAVTTMAMPTMGSLNMDYADDSLVFSRTLEQWTTHNGIDIKASEGTVVKVALDGTVREINKDHELGIVITIDHGDGLETRYGGLSTDEMVSVGQKLKKGDAISGIGKGSGIELADGPHLHFEVIKDGENINPKSFLPKFK